MPRGDRTGPWGQGPLTGRGLGYCSGNTVPGFTVPGPGLGLARGRGFGRGMGFGRGLGFHRGFGPFMSPAVAPVHPIFQPQITKDQEKQFLEQQVNVLTNQLESLKKRIEELENSE